MILAGVDIGSNTTLLSVVRKRETTLEVLEEKIFATRLGENLEKTNQLTQTSLSRLEQAFSDIQKISTRLQVSETLAVATSASRRAKNSQEIFKLAKKYDLPQIKIISPEKEAELTFKGSLLGLNINKQQALVVDIGGGSTEVSTSHQACSLPIGSLKLQERFLQAPKASLIQHISKHVKSLQPILASSIEQIVFTAGTPITLAFLEKQTQNPREVHGLQLSKETLDTWLNTLEPLSLKEKEQLLIPKYRADVICFGMLILKTILEASGKKIFTVSAGGLRYGLFVEKFQLSEATIVQSTN